MPSAPSSVDGEAGERELSQTRRAAARAALAARSAEGSELDNELQLLLAEVDVRSLDLVQPSTVQAIEALQETQRLLATQQAQLTGLMSRLADQLSEQQKLASQQQDLAERQETTASELAEIRRELHAERELQKEAALYLATRGRHSAN